MNAHRLSALLAPLLLAGCAAPRGIPMPMTSPGAPAAEEFHALGELRSTMGRSAAFDGWRVVGPEINLSRSADGSWHGSAGPRMASVHLAPGLGTLSGPGLFITIERAADGFIEIGGLRHGERFTVRISPQRLTGKTGGGHCAFEYTRTTPGRFDGTAACGKDVGYAGIELLGAAAQVEAPILPQFALALLSTLP
jgi:hypothetical protein